MARRPGCSTLALVLLCALTALACPASSEAARGQRYENFTTKTPLREGDTLVLGFMGGREPWDNPKPAVRRLALKLRAMGLPGVHVETVENRKRHLAVRLVREALDRDRDGSLSPGELATARVVLYGQSFGGAAVVKLARELGGLGVPVLFTLQIDSVGRGDRVVPPNVARAANIYQRSGLIIRGERAIVAQDRARTAIVGNYAFDYSGKEIDISGVSWTKRIFRVAHTKMEYDPEVWTLAERLILTELGAAARTP